MPVTRVEAPGTGVTSAKHVAAYAIGAIVLAGLNLRPGIVAVAPVLGDIERDLAMDAVGLGMLTALPLACFALLSPVVPALSRRGGAERILTAALLLLAVASAVRVVPSGAVLVASTVLIGVAIAVGNVLVPVVVKTWFTGRLGLVTGLYSVSLFAGAALAGSVTVPLAHALPGGWRAALGSWGALAALGCLVWIPLARSARSRSGARPRVAEVWRIPLAWWVTAYMGLQSLHYFTVAAWLPQILVDAGHTAATSGLVLGASNVVAMVAALLVPIIANRSASQRWMGVALAAAGALGLSSLLVLPSWPVAAAVLLGLGQGGAIGLALLLVVRRAGSAAHAAALSGMSQSVGYLLAATGAPAVGALHARMGSWTVPIIALIALIALQAVAAHRAGAPRTLVDRP